MLVLLTTLTLAFVVLVPPIIDEFGKVKELLTTYFIEGTQQAHIPGTIANFIKENINDKYKLGTTYPEFLEIAETIDGIDHSSTVGKDVEKWMNSNEIEEILDDIKEEATE